MCGFLFRFRSRVQKALRHCRGISGNLSFMHLYKLNFLLVCIYITLRQLITFSYIQVFSYIYMFLKVLGFTQTRHNGPSYIQIPHFIISSLTTVTHTQLNFKKLKPAVCLSIKWHALPFPLLPGNQDNEKPQYQLTVDAFKKVIYIMCYS